MKNESTAGKKEAIQLDSDTEIFFRIGLFTLPILLIIVGFMLLWGDVWLESGPGCAFHRVVGAYCPGCGGTRAFYYFVHGQMVKSFIYNPFVPVSMFTYIFFMINTFLVKYTKLYIWKKMKIMPFIYIAVGILLGQWIIRNILWLGFQISCLE